MGTWYQDNQRLYRQEMKTLAAACPFLRFAIVGPDFKINDAVCVKAECAVAHGTYGIQIPDTDRDIEYGIVIVFPNNYPRLPPGLFCNDPKLPIDVIDRHIMKNGSACLGVRAEVNKRWRSNPTIIYFVENLVAPFLAWQAYYDAFQKPSPWGERSHFTEGVIEYYAELLGMNKSLTVVEFMKLLARKNRPKGHEVCPCGSGNRLRNCHRELLYNTREKVAWQYVVKDLQAVLRDERSKY